MKVRLPAKLAYVAATLLALTLAPLPFIDTASAPDTVLPVAVGLSVLAGACLAGILVLCVVAWATVTETSFTVNALGHQSLQNRRLTDGQRFVITRDGLYVERPDGKLIRTPVVKRNTAPRDWARLEDAFPEVPYDKSLVVSWKEHMSDTLEPV